MLKSEIAIGTEVLANTGWLSHTPPDFAEAILANCHWRSVEGGATIQHAGDDLSVILGLARGTITMTTGLASPDAPMMHICHAGWWFGFVPLFLDTKLPNGIVARGDVLLASIVRSQLESMLSARPEWWRHVGVLGAIYGNTAANVAADLMIRDSARRCAASLLRLANCRFQNPGGAQQVEAPLSQDELAAISNLSRTSISTILHDLEQSGLITLGYRSVTLNNPARMRSMVDDV